MPEQLNDRARDSWRPLLAIAEAIGGEWPQWAREAASKLSGRDEDETYSIVLLGDIKQIFDECNEPISSTDLVAELVNRPRRFRLRLRRSWGARRSPWASLIFAPAARHATPITSRTRMLPGITSAAGPGRILAPRNLALRLPNGRRNPKAVAVYRRHDDAIL